MRSFEFWVTLMSGYKAVQLSFSHSRLNEHKVASTKHYHSVPNILMNCQERRRSWVFRASIREKFLSCQAISSWLNSLRCSMWSMWCTALSIAVALLSYAARQTNSKKIKFWCQIKRLGYFRTWIICPIENYNYFHVKTSNKFRRKLFQKYKKTRHIATPPISEI